MWERLDRLSRSGAVEHRLVERARIVLRASSGEASREIAKSLGVDIKTVAASGNSTMIVAPVSP